MFIGLDQSVPNRTSFNPETDFQVLIAMGETPRWAVSHGDPSSTPTQDKGAIPAQNLAIVKTDKGYLFELLIPWTLLKPGATVKEGQEIGWTMFANNSKVIGPSDQQVAMSPFGRPKASKNGVGAGPSVWTTAVLSPALSITTTNPPATPPPAGQ